MWLAWCPPHSLPRRDCHQGACPSEEAQKLSRCMEGANTSHIGATQMFLPELSMRAGSFSCEVCNFVNVHFNMHYASIGYMLVLIGLQHVNFQINLITLHITCVFLLLSMISNESSIPLFLAPIPLFQIRYLGNRKTYQSLKTKNNPTDKKRIWFNWQKNVDFYSKLLREWYRMRETLDISEFMYRA